MKISFILKINICFVVIICFVDGIKVLFIGLLGLGKSMVINILCGIDECEIGKLFIVEGIIKERKGYFSVF